MLKSYIRLSNIFKFLVKRAKLIRKKRPRQGIKQKNNPLLGMHLYVRIIILKLVFIATSFYPIVNIKTITSLSCFPNYSVNVKWTL